MAKRKAVQAATVPTIAPRMLAAPAAAAYLGIGTFALRHLHWDKKLRGVFIGRKLLFDLHDLDKYVDALKKAA